MPSVFHRTYFRNSWFPFRGLRGGERLDDGVHRSCNLMCVCVSVVCECVCKYMNFVIIRTRRDYKSLIIQYLMAPYTRAHTLRHIYVFYTYKIAGAHLVPHAYNIVSAIV